MSFLAATSDKSVMSLMPQDGLLQYHKLYQVCVTSHSFLKHFYVYNLLPFQLKTSLRVVLLIALCNLKLTMNCYH